MALQKSLIRRGVPCNYVKIAAVPVLDYLAKEASAHFALFVSADAAAADSRSPVEPIVAKLRLNGAKFDEYLSAAALAGRGGDDPFRSALYAAAKVEPVICNTPPTGGAISVFADAVDV